jgi:hypothetical protein
MPLARLLSPGPSFLVIFSAVFFFSPLPSFPQLSLTVIDKKSATYARNNLNQLITSVVSTSAKHKFPNISENFGKILQ